MSAPLAPSLEQFADECEAFLSSRFEPRRAASAFVWGVGSDAIVLRERNDPGAIDAEVAGGQWR